MIRAIVGLGNPGPNYRYHRHNIGFRILDALAEEHNGVWRVVQDMAVAEIAVYDRSIILIKPLTGMNVSGKAFHHLKKQGISAEQMLIVHDELELPFGKLVVRQGGSARGHNGLRSFIGICGPDFYRLRVGVSRPERKEDVPDYVLRNFSEPDDSIADMIDNAVREIDTLIDSVR